VTDTDHLALLSSLRRRARGHEIAEPSPEVAPDQALVALRRRAREFRPAEPTADAAPSTPEPIRPVSSTPVPNMPEFSTPAPAVLEPR
jgi:hypothetical protein